MKNQIVYEGHDGRYVQRWAKPENVRVRLLGVADSAFSVPGVILSSFTGG